MSREPSAFSFLTLIGGLIAISGLGYQSYNQKTQLDEVIQRLESIEAHAKVTYDLAVSSDKKVSEIGMNYAKVVSFQDARLKEQDRQMTIIKSAIQRTNDLEEGEDGVLISPRRSKSSTASRVNLR